MVIMMICYLSQRVDSEYQVARFYLNIELFSNVFNLIFGCIQPRMVSLSLCKIG